jgi:hypothetical protein
MHIFRRAKDPEGDQIKLEYRYSLKYPKDEIDLNYSEVPFKLFILKRQFVAQSINILSPAVP